MYDCCPRKLNTLLLLLETEVLTWGMKAFTCVLEWKTKRKNDTHVHDTHTAVGDDDDNITVTGRDLVSDFSAI